MASTHKAVSESSAMFIGHKYDVNAPGLFVGVLAYQILFRMSAQWSDGRFPARRSMSNAQKAEFDRRLVTAVCAAMAVAGCAPILEVSRGSLRRAEVACRSHRQRRTTSTTDRSGRGVCRTSCTFFCTARVVPSHQTLPSPPSTPTGQGWLWRLRRCFSCCVCWRHSCALGSWCVNRSVQLQPPAAWRRSVCRSARGATL